LSFICVKFGLDSWSFGSDFVDSLSAPISVHSLSLFSVFCSSRGFQVMADRAEQTPRLRLLFLRSWLSSQSRAVRQRAELGAMRFFFSVSVLFLLFASSVSCVSGLSKPAQQSACPWWAAR